MWINTTVKVENVDNKKTKEQEVPIREYCIGVMAQEIPGSYREEAVKAQAVLVRTEVYRKIRENGNDTVLENKGWNQARNEKVVGRQVWKILQKFQKAWEDTEGKVLFYENELALTPFFRLSTGCTRDGKEVLGSEEYPYLKIVECPLDIEAKKQIQTITTEDLDAEIQLLIQLDM